MEERRGQEGEECSAVADVRVRLDVHGFRVTTYEANISRSAENGNER